jgi:DnaJ-class molecular chaperone
MGELMILREIANFFKQYGTDTTCEQCNGMGRYSLTKESTRPSEVVWLECAPCDGTGQVETVINSLYKKLEESKKVAKRRRKG